MAGNWNGGGKPNFPKTPFVETLLDDRKLRLSAPPISGSKQRPQLSVAVVGGNPRINVYTNLDGDKENGRISAKMDLFAWGQLLEMIEHVIATPDISRLQMANKRPMDQNEQSPGGKREPIHETTSVVGRDKDGKIYIAVLAADNDRPKVIFHFGAQYYHTIVYRDAPQNFLEDRFVSELAAKAWVKSMRAAVMQILTDKAAEKGAAKAAKKEAEGGGGGGGNSGGGKPSGGYNKGGAGGGASKSFDDDFGGASGGVDSGFEDDLLPL